MTDGTRFAESPDQISALQASSGLLRVVAKAPTSRAALMEALGLSRVTLSQRLGMLSELSLIEELSDTVPSGGRPTRLLSLRSDFGAIFAVDVGEHLIRLATTDVTGKVLARSVRSYRAEEGPVAALQIIAAGLRLLAAELPQKPFLMGVGLSLPAPIDAKSGRVMGPSILSGWDGFDLTSWLEADLGVPAIIENDVNVMTFFEASCLAEPVDHFLFVKMGTGIGSGFIADGRLYHGATGASGDIGHIQLLRNQAPLCRCGKVGCLEAHAAGWAIARDLRERGFAANDAHDVVELVKNHVPEAIGLVREAGRTLGEVIADAISILNPRVIRIGGTLIGANEYLLAGVRELVYQRCLPLATNDLRIEAAPMDEDACTIGIAKLVFQRIFATEALERMLSRYGLWFASA